MNQKENRENSACFTGHRPNALPWGYDQNHSDCKALKKRIKEVLIKLIEIGITTFYNGLAEGFDLYSAQILCELKSEGYPIFIVGCIPCENQADYFSAENKELYNQIKNSCDRLYYVTHGHYFKGCTFIRNKYMVDNSSILIAYCHKDTGGTASTLKYAEKKGLEIIRI